MERSTEPLAPLSGAVHSCPRSISRERRESRDKDATCEASRTVLARLLDTAEEISLHGYCLAGWSSRTPGGPISIRSMTRWRLITTAVIVISGLAFVTRLREIQTDVALKRQVVAQPDAPPVVLSPVVFSPVVVVAERPTLSEILDLILKARPTAAELNGGRAGSGDFPSGSDEAYVARMLGRYNHDWSVVHRIAAALVKEGRRRSIETPLLVGVLLTENPWLDWRATSSVGARGLMQVMPFHAGKWGCTSSDLFDIETNICHGVAILADNLSRSRSLPQALLGYNGCVRGTNTPDCRKYPRSVYRRADLGE